MTDTWGCWDCGSLKSRTRNVAKGPNGHTIRRRVCEECGGVWLTEERRLSKATRWFHRAWTAAEQQRIRRARAIKVCGVCAIEYPTGQYARHLRHSTSHRRIVKDNRRAAARACYHRNKAA